MGNLWPYERLLYLDCCFVTTSFLSFSQLAYVEGWKLINLANETFGFNGWSHSVTHQNIGEEISAFDTDQNVPLIKNGLK